MGETLPSAAAQGSAQAPGCAYLFGDPREFIGEWRACGRPPQPGSPYCPQHHARCYLRPGSGAEVLRLLEVEAIAAAVGGRQAKRAASPSRFLRRLERLLRVLS